MGMHMENINDLPNRLLLRNYVHNHFGKFAFAFKSTVSTGPMQPTFYVIWFVTDSLCITIQKQTTCINWRTSGHKWNQIRCTPCLNGHPCWIHANKNRLGDKKDLAIYAYEYYYIPRLMVPPSLFIILNCEWEEYWSRPNGQVNNGKLPSANDNLLLENTELSL